VAHAAGWSGQRVAPVADTLAEGGLGVSADTATGNRPTRLGRVPTPAAAPTSPASGPAGSTAAGSIRPGRTAGSGERTAVPGSAGRPRTRIGNPEQVAAEVVSLVNHRRAAARCAPVRADRRLQEAARRHSSDMAARRSLDARSASGEAPWERAWAQGYYFYAGQAIERGQQDAGAVVNTWMNDGRHKRVLLDCGSKAVGVAVHPSPTGPWWTAIFGYGTDSR
jgi:uncharacterized protein YkwD